MSHGRIRGNVKGEEVCVSKAGPLERMEGKGKYPTHMLVSVDLGSSLLPISPLLLPSLTLIKHFMLLHFISLQCINYGFILK